MQLKWIERSNTGGYTMFRTSHVSDGSQALSKRVDHEPTTKRLSVTSGSLKRWLLTAASLATLVSGLSGCTLMHNGFESLHSNGAWNEAVIVMRNRSFSNKAWHRRKHHFCRQKYISDFKLGFRKGYEDAAQGGAECTPAFPPQRYWGWDYQSAEGQGKTAAWFSGYPHGARAAEEDGVGNWNPLQTSNVFQSQSANSNQPGLNPVTGGQGEPITGTVIETPAGQAIPLQSGGAMAPVPQLQSGAGMSMPLNDPIQ